MKILTRAVFLIVMALAFGIGPALRAEGTDTYAAIAYSPSTGRWVYANGEKTREQAQARAVKKLNCSDARTNWCRNSYIALAISNQSRGGWGSSWGTSCEDAGKKAVAECIANNNPDGHVVLCVSSSGD